MIPQETIDRIIDAARIEEVIGDFVRLKRRGASYVACCPFHDEKTPSFYVTPSKGIYKCFGCGKAGTAVKFIMEHEGMTYPEALKYLARKYGIEVVEKEETAEEILARQRTESLYLVSEFAQKHFAENLLSGEGKTVGHAYFLSRGLTEDTIVKYGLGWARKDRDDLSRAARAAGYKEEYLVETGLCHKNEDGSLTDRFFERVMFPIHSPSGRVIAFGGRTLKNVHQGMKYVNTPTTEIYAKERSLYGIRFAKSEIARRDKCYLVEGYLDVLSLHQLGITNTVASSGTSLTVPQIRLIHKFTENITIMYDGDSAGIQAAMRGIGLVLREGLNVKVVLFPDGEDPDSYVRKHTLEEVETFLRDHEQDFIAFKTGLLLEESSGDPIRKAGLINDVSDTIALIPDAVRRMVYAQSSSETFHIDSQLLFDRINATRERLLQEELKEREREKRREEAGKSGPVRSFGPDGGRVSVRESGAGGAFPPERPAEGGSLSETGLPVSGGSTAAEPLPMENPMLAPSEREFVWFILRYGMEELHFDADSALSKDDGMNVADFFRSHLNYEELVLENRVYREIYDAYFKLYDEDEEEILTQDDIVQKLLNGPDQRMASRIIDLVQDRHELSIETFKNSLTKLSTRLASYVPRSFMVYQIKRIQHQNLLLTEELAETESGSVREEELLKKIQDLAALRKLIEEKLGRVQ